MSFDDIAARIRRQTEKKGQAEDAPRDFRELYLLRARILGVLIRDAREAEALTVPSCAAHIGVTTDTLESWEWGTEMPSLPQLELIAYCLGLPVSHFFGADPVLREEQHRDVDSEVYVDVRNRLIGAQLRGIREERDLTPDQLAEQSGVSAGNITAYELGTRPVPLPVLMTLASACGVSMAYFLERANRVGEFLSLQEDLKHFSEMPAEVRQFVSLPGNQPYLDLAMKLASLGTSELRNIAAAILEITL